MNAEYVLDASAALQLLLGPAGTTSPLELVPNADLHAPHLFDAEVGDVLRRKVTSGELDADWAASVVWALDALVDQRYPHAGVIGRQAWELRHRVRFYDALYVALAARLDLPLLTADLRLSRAHGLPCKVETV
ncbi:hypothetical protein B1813_05540 [Saccharomonospora piscinae]|uniref:Ribonuclease VapC n=1 Tax=Saccharomonospora piscinae TaxID=687388 RepID=A0A1V9AA19_SACPI|nr:type II toxin-antitoxin system VapC family toxin [Saccharomonospora piscinae]OQO93972.1 hypothetical protein B1813_05540 [Saccharomonospora piscinae]TLW95146.1 type II toxin-antitoxin system VapC family toxin [Saccharomonospora piscinae]